METESAGIPSGYRQFRLVVVQFSDMDNTDCFVPACGHLVLQQAAAADSGTMEAGHRKHAGTKRVYFCLSSYLHCHPLLSQTVHLCKGTDEHDLRKIISEYLSNSLCFVALSAEIFSVLFVFGLAENIVTVFLADAVVLLGLLAVGLVKMDLRGFGRKRIILFQTETFEIKMDLK